MNFTYQYLSSLGAQAERYEYVRNLPIPIISVDNRWYAVGSNSSNQLAPLTGVSVEPPSICNLFPVSSFNFAQLNFRDIHSNGNTTVIATSGLVNGIYGVGDNSNRIFGSTETPIRVLSAIGRGNFVKVRAGTNNIWALSTNGTLLYRGRNEPGGTFANEFTAVPGTYNDFEVTYRGMLALSGTDVYVRGRNNAGQLGVGQLGVSRTISVTNFTLLTGQWKRIVTCATADHAFLLSATNARNVWYGAGDNSYNQLGQDGIPFEPTTSFVTEFVHLNATWSDMSVGSYHTIALSGRTAYAAGSNSVGQLGIGRTNLVANSWWTLGRRWTRLPYYQGIAHSIMFANNRLYGAGIADARLDVCGGTGNFTAFTELSADTSWQTGFCAANNTFVLSSGLPLEPLPPEVPLAPTITSILTGNQVVSVNFIPAATTADAPVLNYEYSITDGLNWLPFDPPQTTSPATIGELDNGSVYYISLRGVNIAGPGTSSNTLTARPIGPPNPPVLFTATPGDKRVSVTFAARSNGGSPITNNEYNVNGGSFVAFSPPQTSSPFNVTNLPDNQNITLRFRAVNAFGPGIASEPITSNTFITPLEVFLVGGGGGAGGGGGGGGGVIPWFSITPPSGASYVVQVGAAGYGSDSSGTNSRFGTYIALGGGGGGGNGQAGGSGGGGNTAGRGNGCGGNSGAGTAPQGYRGGYGKNNGNWPYSGGPGGGYSGPGGCHNDTAPSGWALDANTRLMGPFADQGTTYVGSGGGYKGANRGGTLYGVGGIGAGGGNYNGSPGKINAYMYGCGAAGDPGAGFQGVVCVRYPGTQQTYSGGNFIGYNANDNNTYHIFTSDGTFTRIP